MNTIKYLFLIFILAMQLIAQPNYFGVDGKNIIDSNGNTFIMKGVNLGNWLVPEGYMFKFKKANSPRNVNNVVTELIGPSEAKQFWIDFQDNYIMYEDIKYIKSNKK